MIKIVGLESGKLYAEGRREDCFRELHENYEYKTGKGRGGNYITPTVYPEPLLVVPEKV